MWRKGGVFQTALKEAFHKIEKIAGRSESTIGSAQLHTSEAAHSHCCQKPALGTLSTAEMEAAQEATLAGIWSAFEKSFLTVWTAVRQCQLPCLSSVPPKF